MKITPGFDNRNAGFYRWVLFGVAMASGAMLLAGLKGRAPAGGPGGLHAVAWPALALIVASAGYMGTRYTRFSFRWVALAGAVFAIAMYGFGMPVKTTMLVGASSLAALIASLAMGKKGDLQVEDDDTGIDI